MDKKALILGIFRLKEPILLTRALFIGEKQKPALNGLLFWIERQSLHCGGEGFFAFAVMTTRYFNHRKPSA